MPYESFGVEKSREISIVAVEQDPETHIWWYTLHITLSNKNNENNTNNLPIHHEYDVKRRFSEFKEIYNLIVDLIADLPDLPNSGILSYLRGGNHQMLMERRKILEEIIQKAARHPVASQYQEVTDFLGGSLSKSKLNYNNNNQYDL